jgi:hypothetical protein
MVRAVIDTIEPHTHTLKLACKILVHEPQVMLGKIPTRNPRLIRNDHQPEACSLQFPQSRPDIRIQPELFRTRGIVARVDQRAIAVEKYSRLLH